MSTADTHCTELERGTLFADRYEIEALLGRGGMGAVYRARDRTLGETIALKLLSTGEAAAREELLRFRQEVRLARRVTHPNVARVYDFGEHAGAAYLTMELVDGETLRQALRRDGALPPGRAIRVALTLCEGLSAAHAAGVVHRDLKPANVLLAKDGRVVITDFGIARSLTDALGLTSGPIGTPSYMAPEQLVSAAIDGRTDVYALGLVLYEMLTGEKLGGTLRPGLAPALVDLVRRCTAMLPDERPASAAAVAAELQATLDGGPGTIAAPAAPPAAPEPSPEADTRQVRSAAPRTIATLAEHGPSLAVLPFRYRGPKDQDYFGDAITDELVDVLSRTRGLRVLGSGATARYREARDPRLIGAELGASAVIDGTVELLGDRVRITARLLETASGVQVWSERHGCELGDLYALQESIAQRVAEALRLEITTLHHRGAAPSTAIERYLAGRHHLRAFDAHDAIASVENLERCLALAPDFAPAIAAHAIACMRCWFLDLRRNTIDWEAAGRASVARALQVAPDFSETHLACSMLATNSGDYRDAARALLRALSIAPTHADAHEYLGMLQCEAGQAQEGVKRLRLACSLDPTLRYASIVLARQHAFDGDWASAHAVLDDLERRHGLSVAPLSRSQRTRIAAWRGDQETLRRMASDDVLKNAPNRQIIVFYARSLAGELDDVELRQGIQQIVSSVQSPRFLALAEQLATEIFCGLGQFDEARLHLRRAVTNVLVDLEWIDRCPLLAGLRSMPDWGEVRPRVAARAATIWET